MKIMTIVGTRPEIIRLSLIFAKLDQIANHILVHTGQNFDPSLSAIFFKELRIRKPDYYLGITEKSFGEQTGKILSKVEKLLQKERPDKLLILGDTNSGLSSIVAKRLGILVFHMEAGNRCFDDRVPEEINRRIIDHTSDILMPYTERSRDNLLAEGIQRDKIFVVGNPINEVINYYQEKIENSKILEQLTVKNKEYFLVTLHRAENVDIKNRLSLFIEAFKKIQKKYNFPVIISLHPRTRNNLINFHIAIKNKNILLNRPFGFFDFVKLEKNAYCVLSDSGIVQEECCILKIPCVTLRDVTERPETIECGSNILSGAKVENILKCVQVTRQSNPSWSIPTEYLYQDVSSTVAKIILGYSHKRT